MSFRTSSTEASRKLLLVFAQNRVRHDTVIQVTKTDTAMQ